MPSQIEIQQDITNRIIESLNQGTIPWRKPWKEDPNCGAAANVVSKRAYSGINPLLLDLTAMSRVFQSRWWGTFDQWAAIGGQVQKRPSDVRSGDWGTRIVFYRRIERKRIQNGEESTEVFPLLRTYTVFNLDQVDGECLNHLRANNESPNVMPNFEAAQEAIEATKADIRYGSNSAFYIRPSGEFPNHTAGDYICLPNMQQFFTTADFYSTAFHELVHWSECRLGWKGSYAMGELIAEIGTCFLNSQIGIPCSEDLQNHTSYLASWLKEMQEDPRAILRAASQASKAAELVLSFSRQEAPEVLEVE